MVVEIREKLKSKLSDEQEPAMILHLAVTLLYYAVHGGRLVHAPGKAVPLLVSALGKVVPNPIHQRLIEMQSRMKPVTLALIHALTLRRFRHSTIDRSSGGGDALE